METPMQEKNADLSHLGPKWDSTIVARSEVRKFTGGMISPGTMANLDSRGEGPPQIRIGRKVGYKVDDFIEWLEGRVSHHKPGKVPGKRSSE
jgi:hypothetical protein